jgi:hypothetical protein
MPVVQVGLVRVLVYQRLVPVRMGMRLRDRRVVSVPVVLVVDVEVLVLERLVRVHMGMLVRGE